MGMPKIKGEHEAGQIAHEIAQVLRTQPRIGLFLSARILIFYAEFYPSLRARSAAKASWVLSRQRWSNSAVQYFSSTQPGWMV